MLPSAGVVAGLTGLPGKAFVVRIGVATGTAAEGKAQITWPIVRARGVAPLARHFCVQSGKGVSGLGVIELA